MWNPSFLLLVLVGVVFFLFSFGPGKPR